MFAHAYHVLKVEVRKRLVPAIRLLNAVVGGVAARCSSPTENLCKRGATCLAEVSFLLNFRAKVVAILWQNESRTDWHTVWSQSTINM